MSAVVVFLQEGVIIIDDVVMMPGMDTCTCVNETTWPNSPETSDITFNLPDSALPERLHHIKGLFMKYGSPAGL
ncbi:MAG: hypothetical protein IPM82_13495 [Saprospiraceae bacterium]|nr:hypothetical protein [Saprospiraceae bacterium]